MVANKRNCERTDEAEAVGCYRVDTSRNGGGGHDQMNACGS